MKKLIAIAGATMLLVSLTGCSAPFTTFQDALSTCAASSGVQVSDNGTTLSVDMKGETDYTGASYTETLCLIDAVGTPGYVSDAMMTTTAMDGRQHDTFDGIDVSWSYHPDNGLSVLYHKTK